MKQFRTSAFFIILALILLALPHPAHADQQWHYQATAQVTQPGLIETVLPAGVFFGTDNAVKTSQLDLNPRRGRTRATDSNTIIKMNMLTDKSPLAVTIQTTNNAYVYGNRSGSSGGCHA